MMLLFILTNVAYLFVLANAATWQQTPETVCPFEGMSAHLPWRYTLEGAEAFNLVRWYQGKPVGLQIATYQFSSNTFTPDAPYDAPGKLAFDNTTRDRYVSITMNNVALNDSSQYSVTLQPVGDSTNALLRVLQGDIMLCASKGSTRSCGPSITLDDSGGWTFTWSLTDQTPGTELTMDITVDYEDRQIASCIDILSCTSQAVEVSGKASREVILDATISLRVYGTACYRMSRTEVVELKLPPTTTAACPPSTPPSDILLCASKGSIEICGPSITLDDSGGWTFTWSLPDQTPGINLTMDITVDYEGRQIASCIDILSCTSQAVEVSGNATRKVILDATISLRIEGTVCYEMSRRDVVELELPPTTTAACPPSTPSNSCLLSAGGLAGIVVVLIISFIGNLILFILFWRKHGEQEKKECATPSTPPGPLYQNMATYVSGGGAGSGDGNGGGAGSGGGEVPQSLEIVSDPYEELVVGGSREPTRPSVYDTVTPTPTTTADYMNL